MLDAPIGCQLDEFPYASTDQGGGAPPGAWGAHVPAWENSLQGLQLFFFYWLDLHWADGAQFLVVPVPI